MAEMVGYAQPLRAIGQALEVLNIQGFEMEAARGEFFIRGVATGAEAGRSRDHATSKIHAVWGALPHFGHAERPRVDSPETSLELHYTSQDVARLDAEGRSRRGTSNTEAEATSLSQVLRCIGGYLNKKSSSLLKITREADSVVLEYQTSSGNRMKDTFSVKDLYDLWVGMYLQRSGRAAHS